MPEIAYLLKICMPRYFYKAKNMAGKEESGVLDVANERELATLLRNNGYFLLSADKGSAKEKKGLQLSRFNFLNKFIAVSLAEKLFFTRNLEIMIKTGVSLPRAFQILAIQSRSKKLKKALNEISEQIIKGEALSNALSNFPEIFPTLYQETIKIGEETGRLEKSLQLLASQMEREHRLKSKVKTAMVYPAMVLCTAFLIGVLMFIFAVPNLKSAFTELQLDLPFTTQLIFSGSDFLVKRWPLVLLLFGGVGFVLYMALRTKRGGKFKSRLILKIPILSKISRQTNSALAMRTLGSLLKAGVPIVKSLEVGAGGLSNFYFKQSLKEAAKVVEKGEKIFHALKPYENLYSPMVLQMMEIGEETGETSTILEQLAEFYEEEITASLQKISSVIEPILILVIGGLVGFFAISMMQPMFSIMQGIK